MTWSLHILEETELSEGRVHGVFSINLLMSFYLVYDMSKRIYILARVKPAMYSFKSIVIYS